MNRSFFDPARLAAKLGLVLALAAFAGSALAAAPDTRHPASPRTTDPAHAFFAADPFRALAQLPGFATGQYQGLDQLSSKELDDLFTTVYRLAHDVPIGGGRTVRVNEHFTLWSWLRYPRRGVLLLAGPAFLGSNWTIPVEGYDAAALIARRGMFAFTVDYLGTGASFKPTDGFEVTFEANLQAMDSVLSYFKLRRLIPRFDLIGAGNGGSLAAELAADRGRVRSCVMAAMLYVDLVGGPLLSPNFVQMLQTAPNGYAFVPPPGYLFFMQGAPQEAVDYVLSTQPGLYPSNNFLVALERPFFDPSVARVPGLVIYGSEDTIAGPQDGAKLAADYGKRGAELVIMEGAGHAPFTEAPATAAEFWRIVFEFIDP
jgi:pimeloyl-ACP methyl ester carboxylesterase